MLTGVADCPHCEGTGYRHFAGDGKNSPSKAELYHIKLALAEGQHKNLMRCTFCGGKSRIPAARAAAYRFVGREQASHLYVYA